MITAKQIDHILTPMFRAVEYVRDAHWVQADQRADRLYAARTKALEAVKRIDAALGLEPSQS